MAIQRTQDQERAANAYSAVKAVVGKDYAAKYKALAKSAPADIQTNGLGQTVAFWRAKGKNEHRQQLYDHVNAWAKSKLSLSVDLHLWIIDAKTSSDEYRRATVEVLAYLGWVKRFA